MWLLLLLRYTFLVTTRFENRCDKGTGPRRRASLFSTRIKSVRVASGVGVLKDDASLVYNGKPGQEHLCGFIFCGGEVKSFINVDRFKFSLLFRGIYPCRHHDRFHVVQNVPPFPDQQIPHDCLVFLFLLLHHRHLCSFSCSL